MSRNTRIMRSIRIDAGHRVVGHEGKCANFHGHSYTFDIYATAKDLDKIGRVIDFSIIKDEIGGWIEEHWDHAMILNRDDPFAYLWNVGGPLEKQEVFFLPCNPTAENLAKFILIESEYLMRDHNVLVYKVVCHETPNCSATAEL